MNKAPGTTSEWNGKIYARSLFLFFIQFVILIGVLALALFMQKGSDFIASFKDNSANYFYIVFGALILVLILYLYFFYEDRDVLARAGRINLIFTVMDICVLLSWAIGYYLNIYARPIALCAMFIFFLIGRKDAIFMNVVTAFIILLLDGFSDTNATPVQVYSSLFLAFASGMLFIFIGDRVKQRGHLLLAGLVTLILSEITIFLFEISALYGGLSGDIAEIWTEKISQYLIYGLIGGGSATAICITLMPIFEAVFNVMTVFRLRELTDSDSKLLKKLKLEAPGTYNHSAVVAQLAETCAVAIGENGDYARAAGYYHDVGKLHEPGYFTENQGNVNPHDELTPELSCDIIRSHSRYGYELILANHLPKFFADCALQHHGTMPIRYFYAKALKFTDGDLDLTEFSYAGPKPQTKIAAILMIVDACEAASRSMKDKSPDMVAKLVRNIIEERMNLEQFEECDITMADLTKIQYALVNALSGVYHHRISYPTIKYHKN